MILQTERLIIRPYKESDLQENFRLLSDKQNMYYLNDIICETLEEARENLKECIELFESGKARRFAVELNGRLIGSVGYDVSEETPLGKIAHMGWFISPEFQGKGYVTEAAREIIKFGFTLDNLIRLTTGCYSENIPTQRVMEKLGFRKEGERIKAQYHDGMMKDRTDYAINRDEINL